MKMFKKFIAVAVIGAMVFSLAACGGGSSDKKDAGELNIYMWSDYMSQKFVDKFTEETGIKVNFSYMSTSEEAVAKLTSGAGDEYDLAMPCDADMTTLIKGDALEKINMDNVPNYKNIGKNFKDRPFDPNNEYAVPYFANYVYVMYDKTKSPIKITKYEDLLSPKLKGQISSVTGPRNLFPIALASLGYDPNSKNEKEIKAAYEWLKKYKANVKAFDSDSAEKLLINGACSVGFVFDGQARRTFESAENFVVADLKDPIQLGVDEFVIPKGAKNKENAEKFLNYLCDAQNMADNMKDDCAHSCPNVEAVKLMPEDYQKNPAFNIPQSMKDNYFLQLDLGDAAKIYDKYWTELMSDQEQ